MDTNNIPYIILYKGFSFNNEDELMNFKRDEKLNHIIDNIELTKDFTIRINIINEYDYPEEKTKKTSNHRL